MINIVQARKVGGANQIFIRGILPLCLCFWVILTMW